MKNIIIILSATLFLFSCRKSHNCPPPLPPAPQKHDTTYVRLSVIGDWRKEYGSISFTYDSITISYDGIRKEPAYPYFVSADSIYHRINGGGEYAEAGYFLSKSNDTLTIYPTLHTTNIPDVYRRVH